MSKAVSLTHHVEFQRTTTKGSLPGAYGVNLGVVSDFTWEPQLQQTEIWGARASEGLRRRKEVIVTGRALDFRARCSEISSAMFDLMHGVTPATSSVGGTFVPGSVGTITGWVRVKAYDTANNLIGTWELFGSLTVEATTFAGEVASWELKFTQIDATPATATTSNLS